MKFRSDVNQQIFVSYFSGSYIIINIPFFISKIDLKSAVNSSKLAPTEATNSPEYTREDFLSEISKENYLTGRMITQKSIQIQKVGLNGFGQRATLAESRKEEG